MDYQYYTNDIVKFEIENFVIKYFVNGNFKTKIDLNELIGDSEYKHKKYYVVVNSVMRVYKIQKKSAKLCFFVHNFDYAFCFLFFFDFFSTNLLSPFRFHSIF